MKKTLTISVAAYNIDQYLRQALESLCQSDVLEDLEVFVVDDGSADATFEIAREFELRYPQTFVAIHQENAGYGSTVNYSLSHAHGTYFRLLDGDDWYDSAGLSQMVKALKSTDADVIITNYQTGPDTQSLVTVDFFAEEGPGKRQIAGFVPRRQFGMWAMTVKTAVLRACGLRLPEHELYTDQYFCAFPFTTAQTIEYLDCSVYCYRIERDGQSMGRESRLKNCQVALDHVAVIASLCAAEKDNPNYPILLARASIYHRGALILFLLKHATWQNMKEMREFDLLICHISKDVYEQAEKSAKRGRLITLLRRTNYLAYWPALLVRNRLS